MCSSHQASIQRMLCQTCFVTIIIQPFSHTRRQRMSHKGQRLSKTLWWPVPCRKVGLHCTEMQTAPFLWILGTSCFVTVIIIYFVRGSLLRETGENHGEPSRPGSRGGLGRQQSREKRWLGRCGRSVSAQCPARAAAGTARPAASPDPRIPAPGPAPIPAAGRDRGAAAALPRVKKPSSPVRGRGQGSVGRNAEKVGQLRPAAERDGTGRMDGIGGWGDRALSRQGLQELPPWLRAPADYLLPAVSWYSQYWAR